MSCRRMAANKSSLPRRAARRLRRKRHVAQMLAPGTRSSSVIDVRSSGPGIRYNSLYESAVPSPSLISSGSTIMRIRSSLTSAETSSRTAWPRWRVSQPLLDQPQHVVRFLLQQLHVAVARDPERGAGQHVEAAEQLGQAGRHGVLEQDEVQIVPLAQRHQARQHLRQLHDGEQLRRAQTGAPVQHRGQIQAIGCDSGDWDGPGRRPSASGSGTPARQKNDPAPPAARRSTRRASTGESLVRPGPAAPIRSNSGIARRPVLACAWQFAAVGRSAANRRASNPAARKSPKACSRSPATRIMKNSSRFELKIDRNLTRSNSGLV